MTAREQLDLTVSERALMDAVTEVAQMFGWLTYHTYDSRRSEPGFPDLVLVRAPELVFVECKTQRGRVTRAQDAWIEALADCATVDARVVRPSDQPQLVELLTRRRAS